VESESEISSPSIDSATTQMMLIPEKTDKALMTQGFVSLLFFCFFFQIKGA
jgi:hypothetical protein